MNGQFRLLDLFSGIGGFSLGLERSGAFRTVAFCEIEPFCQRVLAKHWPNVPCYRDIRELTAERLAADGIGVDAICGGFPCQDASVANASGLGTKGSRTGLFSEAIRLACDLDVPLLMENVPGLLGRGFGDVLGALAEVGFDAEWDCIPASFVGALHKRERLWIVAYPSSAGREGGQASADHDGYGPQPRYQFAAGCSGVSRHTWATEPDVGRVAHGVPARVDRLRGLGNAVVPQIPELIGRAIAQAEGMTA